MSKFQHLLCALCTAFSKLNDFSDLKIIKIIELCRFSPTFLETGLQPINFI